MDNGISVTGWISIIVTVAGNAAIYFIRLGRLFGDIRALTDKVTALRSQLDETNARIEDLEKDTVGEVKKDLDKVERKVTRLEALDEAREPSRVFKTHKREDDTGPSKR